MKPEGRRECKKTKIVIEGDGESSTSAHDGEAELTGPTGP